MHPPPPVARAPRGPAPRTPPCSSPIAARDGHRPSGTRIPSCPELASQGARGQRPRTSVLVVRATVAGDERNFEAGPVGGVEEAARGGQASCAGSVRTEQACLMLGLHCRRAHGGCRSARCDLTQVLRAAMHLSRAHLKNELRFLSALPLRSRSGTAVSRSRRARTGAGRRARSRRSPTSRNGRTSRFIPSHWRSFLDSLSATDRLLRRRLARGSGRPRS